MKLLRLILHGFKSFADRTEISFAGGITMIVGLIAVGIVAKVITSKKGSKP